MTCKHVTSLSLKETLLAFLLSSSGWWRKSKCKGNHWLTQQMATRLCTLYYVCYILRQKYCEKESSLVAILKIKMAAGYHGNRDGYLALENSPSFKLYLCQFSRFCQKSERFSPLASPLVQLWNKTSRRSFGHAGIPMHQQKLTVNTVDM